MRVAIIFLNAVLVLSAFWIRSRNKSQIKHRWIFLLSILLCCLFLSATFLSAKIDHANWYVSLVCDLCALLFMPCTYLYMRSVIFSRKVRNDDLGHLLPALVF